MSSTPVGTTVAYANRRVVTKMNPEVKTRWVDRLRSGEYKQGRDVLHRASRNTYCCLGVLCDIALEEGVIDWWDDAGSTYYGDFEAFQQDQDAKSEVDMLVAGADLYSDTDLPQAVLNWAGLEETPTIEFSSGKGRGVVQRASLAQVNDDFQKSFKEIADLIEYQL